MNNSKSLLLAIFISLFIVGIVTVSNYYFIHGVEERGTFGDMFGMSNAIFSGLAFAGIIITIILQSRELKLQREELSETRTVFSLQRFENTFFNLLSVHNEITTNLRYSHPNGIIDEGTKVFMALFVELRSELSYELGSFRKVDGISLDPDSNYNALNKIYNKNISSILGHYFRNLYSTLEFIDNARFNHLETKKEEFDLKMEYVRILQGQFSDHQLQWIYYNGLSEAGKDYLKPLIEKYGILKYYSDTIEISTKHLFGSAGSNIDKLKFPISYDNNAFGK